MIEELSSNLYRMEIPLPNNPLRVLNSYLLKGDGRFFIIDTGMNRPECLNEISSDIKKLNVDLNKTDFFVTHLHADHSGLSGTLSTPASTVYFNKIEAPMLTYRPFRALFFDYFHAAGFPEPELTKAMEAHPGIRYGLKTKVDFKIAKEGDRIEIGDFSLKCIETPGHSPGHICLYDAAKKILFAGDHILFDITPNITYWPEMKNSLKNYLTSLEKVYPLEVNMVCPGHRHTWNDHRKRIKELQEHHRERLNEVIVSLQSGEKNVFEIAPDITWDIDCKSWQEFPTAQKWFAFGETIAHIEYLEAEGKIKRHVAPERITFSL